MAIGHAPEVGAKFVELADWPAKVEYLRNWRATVGDNGVGGYGTLVLRSEINGERSETRNEVEVPQTGLQVCSLHETAARHADANAVDVAVPSP